MTAIRSGAAQAVKRRSTLDAARVEISGSDLDLSQHASAVATFIVRGVAYEFTASFREFGDRVAVDLGLEESEEYRLQRGTLRLYGGEQRFARPDPRVSERAPLHLGTWIGQRFSVHTHRYWGSSRDLLDIFGQFQINELPDGIVLVQKGQGRPLKTMLLQGSPGLGLLQIRQITAQAARSLPSWSGTRVEGGELFVQTLGVASEDDGCGAIAFFLVGSTALTIIAPDADVAESDLVRRLSTLRVEWISHGP